MKINLPVSLVIPCYNRKNQTEELLQSIDRSDFYCEIIIVDDNSTEDIKALVDKFKNLDIMYLKNSKNSGPAYSRNVGIENSSHNFVAFTDNDCLVKNDWLIRMYEYISNSNDSIAGVGGKVVSNNDDLVSQYFIYHKILDPWFHKGQYYYVVTANAIFRKKPLIEVGCFDIAIKKAGGEDPGLCFKLMKKNYKFLYNPEGIIFHTFEKSLFKIFKTFYNYGFGCSIQSKKYFELPNFVDNRNFGGLHTD